MPEPSQEAIDGMNRCTNDTSWVYIPDTGEKWVMSVPDDRREYTDTHGRKWYWEPDPRPARIR